MEKHRGLLNALVVCVLFSVDLMIYFVLSGLRDWKWMIHVPILGVALASALVMSLMLICFHELIPKDPRVRMTSIVIASLSVLLIFTFALLFYSPPLPVIEPHRLQKAATWWFNPRIFLPSWFVKMILIGLMMNWWRGRTNRSSSTD